MPISKIKTSSITADAASVNLNIDSGTLFLDVANNNVGIGRTSATYRLDLAAPVGTTNLAQFLWNDGTYNPRLQFIGSTSGITINETYSTGAGNLMFAIGGTEMMRVGPSGTVTLTSYDTGTNPLSASYAARLNLVNTSNAVAGNGSTLSFQSYNGTNPVYAAISGYMQGAGVGGAYGDMIFGTKSDYTTVNPIERLRITAGGYVCVNTPLVGGSGGVQHPFQVNYSDTSTSFATQTPGGIAVQNTDTTVNNVALLSFKLAQAQTVGAGVGLVNVSQTISSGSSYGDLAFYTKPNGSAYLSERMRLLSSGEVVIGGQAALHGAKLTVPGFITAGDQNATNGMNYLVGRYGSGYLNVLGSMYSSGATALGFAVRPNVGSSGFVAAASNAYQWERGAVEIGNGGVKIYTAPSQTTAEGTAISGWDWRMQVTTDGNIVTPYRVSFNAGFSSSPSATGYFVHDVTSGSTLGRFNRTTSSIGYSTSTGRFTAPVDGVYHFDLVNNMTNQGSGEYLVLRRNGADLVGLDYSGATISGWSGRTLTVTVFLSATDYVQPYMYGTAVGGQSTGEASQWGMFSGFLVG